MLPTPARPPESTLAEPLLARFPGWKPIDDAKYRFLEHAFYIERVKAFPTYNSRSWLATLPLSARWFTLTVVACTTLFAGLLLPHRELLSESMPHLITVSGFMGSAVSFLMVFRINNGYGRWVAGRTQWQAVIGLCFSAAACCSAVMPSDEVRRRFLSELLVFPVALKNALRGVRTSRDELVPAEREGLITDEMLAQLNAAAVPPLAVVEALHHTLRLGVDDTGAYQGSAYVHLLNLLQGLAQAHAGCDMCQAKVPRDYVAALRGFMLSWLLLLPVVLVIELGAASLPITALVSLLYVNLEELAVQIDTPFGDHGHNICLEGYCLEVEQALLDVMHHSHFDRSHFGKGGSGGGRPLRFGVRN